MNSISTISLDVSGALAGMSSMVNGLQGQNQAMTDAMLTMVKYNAALNAFELTSKGKVGGSNVSVKTMMNPQGVQGLKGFQVTPGEDPLEGLDNALAKISNVAQFQILKQIINAISSAFVQGTQEAIKFQVAISEIRTIAQTADITFNQWSKGVQELSDKFGHSQIDVAAAAYEALSNQVVHGADTFGFMNEALQFGQVTMASAKQSVDLLSSALKSFDLPVEETNTVAASLFETINLGRVKAEEMANSFGRVGAMAHVLGVSLQETEAAIATLTIQGMKYSDSSTMLTNVLLKLAKPTGEMKKLLEDWGTPTGEAAIATFGFAGVLRKLAEASQGSVAELAELFNEMRSLKGAVGLTKFEGFEDNLAQITNSAESYKNAIGIITESSGKQLQIELNKIKNFFTDDLGQKGLSVLIQVTEKFGGLANMVTKVTTVTLQAGTALGSYWLVSKSMVLTQTALNAVSAVFTTTTAGGTVVIGNMALAVRGLGIAFNTLIPIVGVAVAAWATLTLASDQASQRVSENMARIKERMTKDRTHNIFIDPNETQKFKGDIDLVFSQVGEIIARTFVKGEEKLKSLRLEAGKYGDALGVNFKSLIDNINQGIQEINRNISEARRNIENSKKSVVNFQKTMEDDLFSFKMDFATPIEQIGMLRSRMQDLRDEAKQTFGLKGDNREEIEAARRKYDEIARLAKEGFHKQVELMKQSAVANNIPFLNIAPQVEALKRYYQEILNERTILEQRYQALQQKTINNFQELEAKEKARVNTIEVAVKKFLELQKEIISGKIKDDDKYKDGNKLFDPEKAAKALDEQLKLVISLGGANAKALVDLYSNVEAQKTNLLKVGIATRNQIEIENEQSKLTRMKEQAVQIQKAYTEAAGKAVTELFGKDKAFDKASQDIDDLRKSLNVSGGNSQQFFRSFFNWSAKDAEGIEKSKDAWKQASETMDKVQKTLQNLSSGNTNLKDGTVIKQFSNDINDAERNLRQFQAQYEDWLKKRLNDPTATLANTTPGKDQPSFAELFKDMFQQLSAAREMVANVSKAKEAFDQIKTEPAEIIKNSTGALREAFFQVLETSGEARDGMKKDFLDVGGAIDDTTNKIDAFRRAIEQLNATPINPIPNGLLGGVPKAGQGFATGGFVGGPLGSDNIPAWLTKGEMVINAEATKVFRSQLESMNRSVRPGYYSTGGYVTTNVGDINMNVYPTGDGEVDVRKIARQLRREIKRGNALLR